MRRGWIAGALLVCLSACSTSATENMEELNTAASDEQAAEIVEEESVEASEGEELLDSPLYSYSSSNSSRSERDQSSIIRYEREGITPVSIQIPALEVEAEIENVGLLPGGKMDEPSTMDGVAWYEQGFEPGEQGSAVMAGHVDSRTGPAVFYELDQLQAGDEIIVTDQDGEEKIFVVQRSEAYPREDAPLRQIFGFSYLSQLNLITCTGEFNSEAGTHDERLVVYTVLKDDLARE